MKLQELFNLENLQKALDDKLVKVEKHPELPLYIYNYTANTQFAWVWNDVTLNCRGLIVDEDNNIIARPFTKFFSYEQLDGKLPEGNFEVQEKMDGSMLIVVNYKGNLVTATRGSFVSEQAKRAYKYLNPEYIGLDSSNHNYDPIWGYYFREGLTYIFEIIYPENRIVVDYDYEGLVLLGILDASGMEYDSYALPFKRPKVYSFDSLEKLLECNDDNIEGFVLKFYNDRVKIKTENYKKLHRLITGVSDKTVWEALRENKLDELLENVPDEFYSWVTEVKNNLESTYFAIEQSAKSSFVDLGDRKANAMYYKEQNYPAILFKMLDGQDYSDIIWKMIKPKVTKVFKIVGEDSN